MNYEKITEKKKLLDQKRPLPPALVRNLEDWFRLELTYTSNALEGNTLTRKETALVVEKGLTVGGKSLKEHLEATNHAHALDWIKSHIERQPQDLNEKDILRLHGLILRGIDDDHAGCYRHIPVRLSGSVVILPNPLKVPDLMASFEAWLQTPGEMHPVEYAAEAHYRLVTIHPFVDGNGRTARLLMNMILLMQGYPPAIIRQRDRLAYIHALEKAQLGGTKEDYFKIIAQSVSRSLEVYLKATQGDIGDDLNDEQLFRIGALSKKTGERHSTLRHWIREGLLEMAEITEAGYQLFTPEMITRVEMIRHLQKKRHTLQEIKVHLCEENEGVKKNT